MKDIREKVAGVETGGTGEERCSHKEACEMGRYEDKVRGGIYAHIVCYSCAELWVEEVTSEWGGYPICRRD